MTAPYQAPLQVPETDRFPASNVIQGNDIRSLFQVSINELDRGLPVAWEGLVHRPETTGSQGIDIIRPAHLYHALNGWRLPEVLLDQVYDDVELLIRMHAQESVYVSQRFQYKVAGCHGEELPVCMFSLIVVARPAIRDGQPIATELRHLYIQSSSSAIQQMFSREECHNCWLRRCCHWRSYPRDFSVKELSDIQAVLSTSQASWGSRSIPDGIIDIIDTTSMAYYQEPTLRDILRQFVNNKIENRDALKVYDEGLLSAIQNSTRSSQQQTRSMTMSLKEDDFLLVLDLLLSPCFMKVLVNETLGDLWKRAYRGHRDSTLSFECETVSQTREEQEHPSSDCSKSTVVTTSTKYSWFIVTPRSGVFDSAFISSDIEASYLECDPLPDDPEKPSSMIMAPRTQFFEETSKNSKQVGTNARWSVSRHDGSFYPVHYLAQWTLYPFHVNNAAMDIVRLAAAIIYLRIFNSDSGLSSDGQGLLLLSDDDSKEAATALESLNSGIATAQAVWDLAKSIFGREVSETIKRQVCLGFKRYEHSVTAMSMMGIDQDDLPYVLDSLLKMAHVPAGDDLETALLLSKYSTDYTWSGELVSYTSKNGMHQFFYIYKHARPDKNKVDIVFGLLKSDFKLAEDVLIVHRKESRWGGMSKSEEVFYRNVPHILTPKDTALLNLYFEVVAYRKLAMVTNATVPDYPNMDGLCDFQV
ncbi:hypothetical protein BGZ68_002118 [Mortierella alpina]|nr:hypothetical protein BGZ68_002118 [Mortierella alpina]